MVLGRTARPLMTSSDLHPKRRANPDARCPKAYEKDIHRLVQAAWEAGWWCERTRKNYIRCLSPDGRHVVSVPSTPHMRGHRLANLRSEFRNAGLNV